MLTPYARHALPASIRSFVTVFLRYRVKGQTIRLKLCIAELMGHEKPTLALSAYSGGLRLDARRKAVDVLEEVMEPEVLGALRAANRSGLNYAADMLLPSMADPATDRLRKRLAP